MEAYTVRLENGGITYTPSVYACDECGWSDTDRTFFYEREGAIYCSLHIREGK